MTCIGVGLYNINFIPSPMCARLPFHPAGGLSFMRTLLIIRIDAAWNPFQLLSPMHLGYVSLQFYLLWYFVLASKDGDDMGV